jgi:hypothetical protein
MNRQQRLKKAMDTILDRSKLVKGSIYEPYEYKDSRASKIRENMRLTFLNDHRKFLKESNNSIKGNKK